MARRSFVALFIALKLFGVVTSTIVRVIHGDKISADAYGPVRFFFVCGPDIASIPVMYTVTGVNAKVIEVKNYMRY